MLLAGFAIVRTIKNKPNRIFLRGVPQASQGKSHGLPFKFNYY